jgi:hypothetical protein
MAKVTRNRSTLPASGVGREDAIDRQIAAARAKQSQLRNGGLVAVSARYDRASRRVLVEMSSGLLVGVPVAAIASLAGANDAQLEQVDVDELGSGLRWDALDADVSVQGILFKQLGYSAVRRSAAAAGGRAKTDAKAAAARANGRKGGRPKGTTKTR